jgi:hypothetical protein
VARLDTERPLRLDEDDGARRRRRALYIVFNSLVTVIVLAAVVEALTGAHVYGVDTTSVTAQNADTTLEVRYAAVTRGQLVTPLDITVTRVGGFEGPLVLQIGADYLSPFITQGPTPEPGSETSTGKDLLLTFDDPPGDTFAVTWNLSPEPVGSFTTAPGSVAVLDTDQRPLVAVHFDTQIRP